jgi:hypothetical protein
VAAHYDVQKRAITQLALKEKWSEKLREAEQQMRERAEEKAQETLRDMNLRHLKTTQLVQKKALDALRTLPLNSGMEAVRALMLGMEKERLIRGEPTERIDVAEILKERCESLLLRPGEDEVWEDDSEPSASDPAE